MEDEYSTVMYVCSCMIKSEKAMGEALKRVAKECQNDDKWTQMNKVKKEFLEKSVVWAPKSVIVGSVNVAEEEKQKRNISQHKYERWMC